MGYRTLAVFLLSAIGSTDAEAGAGLCPAGGPCSGEEAVRASALLQVRGERKRRANPLDGEIVGERRMVQRKGQEVLLEKTELIRRVGSMEPATENEKDEFLRVHNEFRCMHGSPPLTWSDAMAQNASEYADPLTAMTHSSSYSLDPPEGPAGENLFEQDPPATPEVVVKSWYDESEDCINGPTAFTDGCRHAPPGKQTLHFTAMIWKGAKELGCAWNSSKVMAICRYRAGDDLSYDTPNILPESNFVAQVPQRIKSREVCQAELGTAPAPTPATPAPAPATPAPTPAPAPGGVCVTGSGAGGCTMTSSGCGGQVEFQFHCSTGATWTIGMPDNYVWDLHGYCPECSNIVVN